MFFALYFCAIKNVADEATSFTAKLCAFASLRLCVKIEFENAKKLKADFENTSLRELYGVLIRYRAIFGHFIPVFTGTDHQAECRGVGSMYIVATDFNPLKKNQTDNS